MEHSAPPGAGRSDFLEAERGLLVGEGWSSDLVPEEAERLHGLSSRDLAPDGSGRPRRASRPTVLVLGGVLALAALAALAFAAFLPAGVRQDGSGLADTLRDFAEKPAGTGRRTGRGAGRRGATPTPEPARKRTRGAAGREPRPWREARARAERVVDQLPSHDIPSLLHGFRGEGPGYFVGNVGPFLNLSIPPLKMQDASIGFRTLYPSIRGTTTQWPCLLALASTWDEGIVGDVAAAVAREFLGKGANVLLGPAVNVHRTAYGGRNFEYLSGEDPYLGSRLTRAYVRSVQREGVMAVVKHFAFNEQETARGHESSDVDERTAWELYYPPFEAAVEAGAAAVMCSYNQVNGTSACENEELLVRDLKGRMGFRGFVMSDWTATHSTQALEQGLDMEQPHGRWFSAENLLYNASSGALREAAVRVLSAVYRLRLDEKPGCTPPCKRELETNQRSEAHLQLARFAATQSVTLLQNDGVLPLDLRRVRKLAVLGRAADVGDDLREWGSSPYAGGGSSHVLAPRVVSPLAAIRERAGASGVKVLFGANGTNDTWEELNRARALVLEADVVVVAACALSREGKDRRTLSLAWEADALIHAVAQLRPTVVLLHSPGAVLTPWRNQTAAIANLFYGGEQTGWAWAAVLFGDHAPTGRLPIEFPATEADAIRPGPAAEDGEFYPVPYTEGMLTSYRSPVFRAAFPFGHGLTYTRFHFHRPRALLGRRCPEAVCLRVNVTNAGRRAGSEVVQAYLEFVRSTSEPHFVLRSFRKTRVLHPGQSQEVLLALTHRDLSAYSPRSGWERRLDVRVHLGASSADIRHVLTLPASCAARLAQGAWLVTLSLLILLRL